MLRANYLPEGTTFSKNYVMDHTLKQSLKGTNFYKTDPFIMLGISKVKLSLQIHCEYLDSAL